MLLRVKSCHELLQPHSGVFIQNQIHSIKAATNRWHTDASGVDNNALIVQLLAWQLQITATRLSGDHSRS